VDERAQEVRQRDEEHEQVAQAQVDLELVKDVDFHTIGVLGHGERDQDQNDAIEILEREAEGQARDADPLKRVHLIFEAHVQVDPVEVPHRLPKAANHDPVDNPVVLKWQNKKNDHYHCSRQALYLSRE